MPTATLQKLVSIYSLLPDRKTDLDRIRDGLEEERGQSRSAKVGRQVVLLLLNIPKVTLLDKIYTNEEAGVEILPSEAMPDTKSVYHCVVVTWGACHCNGVGRRTYRVQRLGKGCSTQLQMLGAIDKPRAVLHALAKPGQRESVTSGRF